VTRQIIQVLAGASEGDAITNMALRMVSGLSRLGSARTFSVHEPPESMRTIVEPLEDAPLGRREDILVYHLSYGNPDLTRFVLRWPGRLVVMYHNVTPVEHFLDLDEQFAMGLAWGREEVRILADRTDLAFACSEFSARDLRIAGYRNVTTEAVGVDPRRLDDLDLDTELVRKLDSWSPEGYVVSVGQLLPHKRHDLSVSVAHALRTYLRRDLGMVIVGRARHEGYLEALVSHIDSLPDIRVTILGLVSDRELATLYRTSVCYLNMSDHEGFGIPPLEAMSCGAAVVVRDNGALLETVGDGGLVLPNSWGPDRIAAAVAEVVGDDDLLGELRRRGQRRVRTFDVDRSVSQFVAQVEQIL